MSQSSSRSPPPTDSPPDRDDAESDLRTHEGFDRAYVLNGTLRLVLGDQHLLLKPGEAAEFDTRTTPEPINA